MDTNLSMEAEANLKGKVGSAIGSYSTNSETEVNTEVQLKCWLTLNTLGSQARSPDDE